jgi:ribonuclease HII
MSVPSTLFDPVSVHTDARLICGIDEAGRGPLAGPVVAAAVILNPERPILGLRDSKKLSPARRTALAEVIRERAWAWSVAEASVAEIDALNILGATLCAMERAVAGLAHAPNLALVDGNRAPALLCPVQLIVRGDALEPCISAASILAKTVRDAHMMVLHERYPDYGFNQHMGYPTAFHREQLQRHGPSPVHRLSFAPVRASLQARAGSASRGR